MNQKGFINIVFVVIIVIIAVGGYFVFLKKSEPIAQQSTATPTQKVQTPTPVATPTPTPSPTPAPTDLTANWKTYRNQKYGFEVKYPKDLIPRIEPADETVPQSHDLFFFEKVKFQDSIFRIYPYPYTFTNGTSTKDNYLNSYKNSKEVKFISEQTFTSNGLQVTYAVFEPKLPTYYQGSQKQIYYAFVEVPSKSLTFLIAGPDLPLNLSLDDFLSVIRSFRIL